MDASASPKPDPEYNEVYGFYFKINNTNFPNLVNQKGTVIKYTKIPEFDFDTKVTWPQNSYTLQPRLRRIITLEEPDVRTTRSLKADLMAAKAQNPTHAKRKIVTITEDQEHDLYPKFSKDVKSGLVKISNRSFGTDYKDEKLPGQRTTTRLATSKYSKDSKATSRTIVSYNNKNDVSATKLNLRCKQTNVSSISTPDNIKMKNTKEKDFLWNAKNINSRSRNNLKQSESKIEYNTVKNNEKKKYNVPKKEKSTFKSPPKLNRSKATLNEVSCKNKSVVIHVPLDHKCQEKRVVEADTSQATLQSSIENLIKVDQSTNIDNPVYKDVIVNTDPLPKTVNTITEMDDICFETVYKSANVQTEFIDETFDCLEIPDVSLVKDKTEPPEILNLHSRSLPNLQVPTLNNANQSKDNSFCKSSSYIISRATLTYTTKQKINFVVNDTSSNSSSPLAYPMNVVSVFKKEINSKKEKESSPVELYRKPDERTDCLDEMNSLNCSYVFNSNKLVKPSDIISTMRVNNCLLHSEYICEQFQRELNFLDSFFESLQYLENCSLSDKCLSDNKVDSWAGYPSFDVKNSEYDKLLSKLENGANVDDTETMASESLCLLNLLIRDEQRRAKNLLLVLKMREDALKDFTKSQILWLENKKRQENTDISTLKKKQRGALLKLQHECGEMQRMRKALLTRSEKRKIAFMKTKKNIELKLRSNVDVDQILLGKKKLKRNAGDRNKAPLKCFDLSSSGCEDSTTSQARSETLPSKPLVTSAEKCIQTGDIQIDQATNTAAENFVVVDGSYLNIIFHNLSFPQIFSSGKQYEVNEEALKNIVNTSNSQHSKLNDSDVVEKLMDQIKNRDSNVSTPSTARSLVEELDQYYKELTEDDRAESPKEAEVICEVIDVPVQVNFEKFESRTYQSVSTMTSDSTDLHLKANSIADECICDSDPICSEVMVEEVSSQTGPLVMPVGEPAEPDIVPTITETPLWLLPKSSSSTVFTESSSVSSQRLCASIPSDPLLTSPVHSEAEELRRQQLAIEREIKALEQQQCQLLVVREIPDKPPPPYTPPTDPKTPKPPRLFLPDETTREKILTYITEPSVSQPTDVFDLFVKDFCHETLELQRLEISDKPWDAVNLLPQKPPLDVAKCVKRTSADLDEILTGVTPNIVSGVSSRRSDHIDDILFAEWRRCEPEWTTLHSDEALVKNQLFESIFQKILAETVDEYKKSVLTHTPDTE